MNNDISCETKYITYDASLKIYFVWKNYSCMFVDYIHVQELKCNFLSKIKMLFRGQLLGGAQCAAYYSDAQPERLGKIGGKLAKVTTI